jgi:hypothetical protein
MQVEILSGIDPSITAARWLRAIEIAIAQSGDSPTRTASYLGGSQVLVLFGVGAPVHDQARKKHIEAGGRVVHFDMGYFGDRKSYVRLCIDADHPQDLLDNGPHDSGRWDAHGIELREDANPSGTILLIGLGKKSRAYLGLRHWEAKTLARLEAEYPDRQIIYRPKGRDDLNLGIHADPTTPIAELLLGASMVVCRHSNVAVDAAIAGVPFTAENGAAMWLLGREFTRQNRLKFLSRLAHWQYKTTEAPEAWAFAKRMISCG